MYFSVFLWEIEIEYSKTQMDYDNEMCNMQIVNAIRAYFKILKDEGFQEWKFQILWLSLSISILYLDVYMDFATLCSNRKYHYFKGNFFIIRFRVSMAFHLMD